ncbi:unnamed protein product [Linum trigynum]|uniref:Uncharacterized protein n=1 Tax=Linum trigynum TaxID=586398 RepID=A0AAV2EXP4_9ROSI
MKTQLEGLGLDYQAPKVSAPTGKGRIKHQKAASAPLVEEEIVPTFVQPNEEALAVDIPSDPELDVDDLPLAQKLKRKQAEDDTQAHSKKQRTSAEKRVPDGRPIVDAPPAPPEDQADEEGSDSGSESSDDSTGEE